MRSAVHQSRQLGCTVESFTSVDLLAYRRANGIAADRCWYPCAELDDDWQVRGQGVYPGPPSQDRLVMRLPHPVRAFKSIDLTLGFNLGRFCRSAGLFAPNRDRP